MKIETAKKVYPQAPSWYQEVLEDEFGKEKLIKRKFTDIKTLEDAMSATGHTTDYLEMAYPECKDEWAYRMLKMVIKAINQDWIANWEDSNQRKYWPYFNLSSGFSFSTSSCHCDYAASNAGSRLCFESEEKCKYVATQFIELYREFLTISK